ncbi:hypothetical protein [Desulfolutivibrio sulfoxidireducens]|uniref:hypothetical protein n=1 Tax=Desulfolutivibrio sulfoxidireducens TaxID=2773299 RepID=UPI00159DBBED|nr:hypothetical protein [Desulfolutivibrio sulfoxidireducens]QLA18689.1 hypothetical protein GD604_02585 [Desulfolutivibrio sulfoxidireducens]
MKRRQVGTARYDGFSRYAWRCAIHALFAVSLVTAAATARAGDMVSASCPCGFQRQGMPVFGGFATFKTSCLFPALCLATRDMVLGNLMDPAAGAKDCPASEMVFFNDPSLAPAHPGRAVASWNMPDKKGSAVLYEGGYVCPACGRRTLRFRHVGVWD